MDPNRIGDILAKENLYEGLSMPDWFRPDVQMQKQKDSMDSTGLKLELPLPSFNRSEVSKPSTSTNTLPRTATDQRVPLEDYLDDLLD